MAEQTLVSGKAVKVGTHRDMCPIPNGIDEVLRLNNKMVRPHNHTYRQGTNVHLPDGSWARKLNCRFCPVIVMVMLSPTEVQTWGAVESGSSIAERARAR